MESSVQKVTHIDNIRLSDDGQSVIIIDQTQLPNRTVYLTLSTAEEMYDAIFQLKIRGAPAIGICAGYCLYCLAKQIQAPNTESFLEELNRKRMYLRSSRPTAVNLSWALNRVYQTAVENRDQPREKIIELMKQEAIKIHEEDIAMCRAIRNSVCPCSERETGF